MVGPGLAGAIAKRSKGSKWVVGHQIHSVLVDTKGIQTLLPFYQVLLENPAFPDATLWMWFDAPVVIRGTVGFLFRYIRARLMGLRVTRQPAKLVSTPEVTWFITTRDLPGPLLHTLATGIANTRYPNLRIVILDCGYGQPAQRVVDRIGDPRISIVTAQNTQPEWYQWICNHPGTEYFVVTHDDLHFVAEGWLEDIVQPMIMDQTIGCVCGEEFPIRLNTVEPGGERVDITFGLSTWMWAARRAAVQNRPCDFSFSKHGRGTGGQLEVWDQGGLWLERLKSDGWRIAFESPGEAIKWQHFENLDWTRDAGDRKYARLKHWQRSIITVLAQVQLMVMKVRKRA
jgi:hypothetical protein